MATILERSENHPKQKWNDEMYQVYVNSYRLVHVTHGKPYYIYNVDVINRLTGDSHQIQKRYSEFNALHRMLKKICQAETAQFPPKRVRNSNPKVLEHRRVALEVYMQKMLRLSNTKQQVLHFLGINEDSSSSVNTGNSNYCKDNICIQSSALEHHPVLMFRQDSHAHTNSDSNLPDIVVNGVLLGIYKS